MIENPLYKELSEAEGLNPDAFAKALADYPPGPAEGYGLIPLDALPIEAYRLHRAEKGFELFPTDLMPGAGFYMIESENGAPSHRFAGGAAFTQILLPVTSEGALEVEISLKHVFDPACAEGVLAFINGVAVSCETQRGETGPEALIVKAPGGTLSMDQASILTLVPPGHVEIEGGARRVAFGVTAIHMRKGGAAQAAREISISIDQTAAASQAWEALIRSRRPKD